MRQWQFLALDTVLVFTAAFGALLIRENFWVSEDKLLALVPYALISSAGAVIGYLAFGTHRSVWRFVALPDLMRITKAITLGLAFAVIIVFMLTRLDGVPRSLPIIHWGLSIVLLVAIRHMARLLRRSVTRRLHKTDNAVQTHAVVVGLTQVAELYLRCVKDLADQDMSVVGILDEDPGLRGRSLGNCRTIGVPADLPKILAEYNIHGIEISKVVLAMPFDDLSDLSREVLLRYERSGVVELDFFHERLGFDTKPAPNARQRPAENADTTVSADAGVNDNYRGVDWSLQFRIAKRAIDMLGAVVALAVLAPLFAVVSVLVLIDLGRPLTFWQMRPGKGGRSFRVYKFRTMSAGHDEQGGVRPDDQRISRIGALLRRTRLDELPQIFNILLGDMSFVGPRPLLPIYQPKEQALRLSVRPGLTGWAQINGGNDLSAADKAALDLWYLKRASLWLDLKIMVWTIGFLVVGDIPRNDVLEEARREAAGALAAEEEVQATDGDKVIPVHRGKQRKAGLA